MKFERKPPPPHLKDYIQYCWTLESDESNLLPKTLGPLADGCPGLIFQPSRKGVFFDHHNKQLPEIFVYGQTVTRTAIRLTGKFNTVGISFYPNALKPIFGFNANELTDTCLDANVLPIPQGLSLSEQLLDTSFPAKQIEILSSFLSAQVSKNESSVDPVTRYALSIIIQSKGMVPLKELQKSLNLSERSFERRFNQHVGISPKLFSRVCQFQSSLRQLKNNQYTKLSDVAFDNGYADQSHFIRTFKEFAGFAPYQLQKQASGLADHFLVLLQ